MRALFLVLAGVFGYGQTAVVPATVVCPAGQLTVATKTSTLGSFVVLTFACLQVPAGATVNMSVAPWTLLVMPPAVATVNLLIPVSGETLTPAVDGITATFSFAHPPAPGTIVITQNGLVLAQGVDYAIATLPAGSVQPTSATVTFTTPPLATALVRAYYSYTPQP